MAISSFLTVNSVVHGYHVYLAVWEPCVEEGFIALHESRNPHNSHTMAVYHDEAPGVIVGHLPWELSQLCHYFTRLEGKIIKKVTRRQKRSKEANGMEILCRLKFTGSARNIQKLNSFFHELNHTFHYDHLECVFLLLHFTDICKEKISQITLYCIFSCIFYWYM